MSTFKELNISNPGTSTKYGGNDTDLINKLFNGVTSGIPAVRIRSQNKFGFDDGILWIYNQALSKKTTIRGQSNAPATDVDLRLPPITGNDTLAAIGLQNLFSVKQQMNAGVLHQEMEEPATPSVGFHHTYVDSTTKHFVRKDSTGAVTDLEALTSSPGSGSTYSLADYFVFIDTLDGNKVKAINCHTGTVDFIGTGAFVADVVLNSVTNALTSGSINGGKIYIDSGTYLINNTDADAYGVKIGGTSTGPNYFVHMQGAGRDVTILKNTVSTMGHNVLSFRSHWMLTDLTVDGDNLGIDGAVNLVDNRQTANFGQIYHCKFRKHTKHACFLVNSIIGSPSGFIVAHNLFELPGGGWDQFPSETYDTGWGSIIAHNIFDGSKLGSMYAACVTPGASYNLIIEGNIFRGLATPTGSETIYQGISCEPNGNHHNLVIRNNIFEHKNIQIGAFWDWSTAGPGWNPQTGTQTYRNVTIQDNIMVDGTIRVQGPNDVAYTNSIKIVKIENNTIQNARREGIGCRKIADGLTVKDNTIVDSNSRQTASGTEDGLVHPAGLILIEYCTNAQASDNYLEMTTSANSRSPWGIKYSNNVNLRMKNNRIINTTANPSTVDGGGNTGTTKENIYGDITTSGDLSDALTLNKVAEASIAELLYTFKLETNAQAYLKIFNGSNTNGIFYPLLQSFNGGAGSTNPSQKNKHVIEAAQDTGTTPILIHDFIRDSIAAITTRPLEDIQNNGTSIWKIWSDRIQTTLPFKGFKLGDISKVTSDSPYTALSTDSVIRIDNSASTTNFVQNLPTAVGITGTKYMIVRTDILASTNTTIVTPNGTETISACSSWMLRPGEFIEIISDGTNWQVINSLSPSISGYYRQKGSTLNRRYIGGMSYSGETALVNSTTLPAINTLWAFPIVVDKVTKFDVITFKHSTNASAGGVARAGIYRDNGNLYPGALMFDTGSKAVDSGAGTAIDTTISTTAPSTQVLQPGLYWLAWECGVAAPQVLTISAPTGLIGILGQENTFSTANRAGHGYSVAHTFGALPDPYTAAATVLVTNPGASVPYPAVGLRPI